MNWQEHRHDPREDVGDAFWGRGPETQLFIEGMRVLGELNEKQDWKEDGMAIDKGNKEGRASDSLMKELLEGDGPWRGVGSDEDIDIPLGQRICSYKSEFDLCRPGSS